MRSLRVARPFTYLILLAPVVPLVLATIILAGSGVAAQGRAQAPTATAAAAPSTDRPPTPLEQAVIEHNCRLAGQTTTESMSPAGDDASAVPSVYDTCLREQLLLLRAEFGLDVKKLTSRERRAIDQACSALRVERGRDAYIACLSDRLSGLIVARGHVPSPPVRAEAPEMVPAVPEAPGPSPTTRPVQAESQGISLSTVIGLGGILVLLAAVGTWNLMAKRARATVVLCRTCGELASSGDLCAACRHEAAETQRRVAAERSEHHRALAEAAQRAEAISDEPVAARAGASLSGSSPAVPLATTAASAASPCEPAGATPNLLRPSEQEAALLHEREQALRLHLEREAARRRDEARRWQEAAVAAIAEEVPFDPRAVLGVPADATPEQVRTAYDAARAKYAPEQVAHLGSELQDHYRAKAEAVERAFESLSGAIPTV
ncbi:MAG: hypothetical protein AB7N65_23165 [Vicinamibacterales bacterium]